MNRLLLPIAMLAATASSPISSTPEPLKVVTTRVLGALRTANWRALRQDGAAVIVIEEQWAGYDDYFVKAHQGMTGELGESGGKTINYTTHLKNSPNLSKSQASVFRKFCAQVQDSWEGYHTHGSGWYDLNESADVVGLDSGFAFAPCAFGRIASNLDWAVEFVQVKGVWKVRRLVLSGH
ncbi:MAG: hypothetical protein ABL962_14110 [Fimbriimonadaceae bacterium]